MGVGGQRHAPAALHPGKTRYPLYRRRGGPQGRSVRVRKIFPPTGFRSPDRPARSESLYRLSYPGSLMIRHRQLFAVTRLKAGRIGISNSGRDNNIFLHHSIEASCGSSSVLCPVSHTIAILLRLKSPGRQADKLRQF